MFVLRYLMIPEKVKCVCSFICDIPITRDDDILYSIIHFMHPLFMFHPREWIVRPTIPMWADLDIVMSRPREWIRKTHQFQYGHVRPINSSMGRFGHPYETFFIRDLDPRILLNAGLNEHRRVCH